MHRYQKPSTDCRCFVNFIDTNFCRCKHYTAGVNQLNAKARNFLMSGSNQDTTYRDLDLPIQFFLTDLLATKICSPQLLHGI